MEGCDARVHVCPPCSGSTTLRRCSPTWRRGCGRCAATARCRTATPSSSARPQVVLLQGGRRRHALPLCTLCTAEPVPQLPAGERAPPFLPFLLAPFTPHAVSSLGEVRAAQHRDSLRWLPVLVRRLASLTPC
jgi:hypothetical protein